MGIESDGEVHPAHVGDRLASNMGLAGGWYGRDGGRWAGSAKGRTPAGTPGEGERHTHGSVPALVCVIWIC
jgi:hypothetical protein